MSAAEFYRDRRAFVESLATGLSCFQDFEAIQYAWSIKDNGGEYVRIQDSINNDTYLHVEGLTDAEIYKEICKVILADDVPECVPDRLITDTATKRKIVPLFREEARS